MEFKNKLKEFILENKLDYFTDKNLAELMNLTTSTEIKECIKALNALLDDGELIFTPKNKYALPSSLGFVKGVLRGNRKGFAFLLCEGGEDVFIPAKYVNGAFNNDTVLVKLSESTRGSSKEGEVVKIISRGNAEIVGKVQNNVTYGFVIPDDSRFNSDIFLEESELKKLKTGTKVVVSIVKYPKTQNESPVGKIVEVLGNEHDPFIDVISIIRSHNIKEKFPEAVVAEAKATPQTVSEKDLKGREDFRNELIITIDGEDARDFDDAISINKNDDGTFELGVHIADVSNYVRADSPLDKEAFSRGTSYYYPDLVIPMLPRELSNGICSLNEGVDRLTLSVVMTVDTAGRVVNQRVVEGVICSKNRMTYTSVSKMLDGDKQELEKYSHLTKMVEDMASLTKILQAKRTGRGSIDFDLPECKITLNEKGRVVDVAPYERTLAHRMIEEFMILANETIAEFVFHLELPFIYRIHANPSEEKIDSFKHFVEGLGLIFKTTKGEIHSRQYLDFLEKIKELPCKAVVNRVMLRTMQKAKYSPDNSGHFGLASEYYCHFTSPIRRYPDLMIHRIIKLMLNGRLHDDVLKRYTTIVFDAATKSSDMEKVADESERDVDDLKKAEFMKDKIGMQYKGVISGVTDFGIFVELDNTVEGMIKLENLPDDEYECRAEDYKIVGKHHKFGLGDSIGISVEAVNMDTRRIEFVISE